ncbi:hypothetical protein ZIOFF_012004 [Zingiber officinale]|uniref:Uncharacterized protein n=1 Tax=Zingiber officinale TaxID=94328 RepID=A0A8J5LQG2_ZINOF|nr:hypothetical protein ZIOFF_012004 [Zingiber officinale]
MANGFCSSRVAFFSLMQSIVVAASLLLRSGFTAFSTTICGGTTAPPALVRHAHPESALKASDSAIESLSIRHFLCCNKLRPHGCFALVRHALRMSKVTPFFRFDVGQVDCYDTTAYLHDFGCMKL